MDLDPYFIIFIKSNNFKRRFKRRLNRGHHVYFSYQNFSNLLAISGLEVIKNTKCQAKKHWPSIDVNTR